MNKNSKCIYCGLQQRGKGCLYSPSKTHIHSSKNHCIYCGLTLRGKGCIYSPNGYHIRFVDFGQIQAEQTNNHLVLSYIVEKLRVAFKDTVAYELGIIDDNGYQVRIPETLAEQACYTPIDRYVFRLKRVFGDKLDIINTDMFIESAMSYDDEDLSSPDWDSVAYSKKYDKIQQLKQSLKNIQKEYYTVLREATINGVSSTNIEKVLLEVASTNEI